MEGEQQQQQQPPQTTPTGGGFGGPKSAQDLQMQAIMESCPVKFVGSSVMGFLAGGALGLFLSGMEFSTPADPNAATSVQIKQTLKDMGSRSYSSAKNFAVVAAIFSGTECVIESYRAKNDLYNGAWAGCITGGILAAKSGPKATAFGCAGFAAFSTAIEYYMMYREE